MVRSESLFQGMPESPDTAVFCLWELISCWKFLGLILPLGWKGRKRERCMRSEFKPTFWIPYTVETSLSRTLASCGHPLLGYTPKACKPCSCPALRPKKETGDSNRNIQGLLDRGVLHKGSWSNTPPRVADGGQDVAAVFAVWGRRRLPCIGESDVRWVHQLPGTN